MVARSGSSVLGRRVLSSPTEMRAAAAATASSGATTRWAAYRPSSAPPMAVSTAKAASTSCRVDSVRCSSVGLLTS